MDSRDIIALLLCLPCHNTAARKSFDLSSEMSAWISAWLSSREFRPLSYSKPCFWPLSCCRVSVDHYLVTDLWSFAIISCLILAFSTTAARRTCTHAGKWNCIQERHVSTSILSKGTARMEWSKVYFLPAKFQGILRKWKVSKALDLAMTSWLYYIASRMIGHPNLDQGGGVK